MSFDQRNANRNLSRYFGSSGGGQGFSTEDTPGVQHSLGHSASTNTSVGRRTSWSTESQGNIGINAQTLGSTLKFDAGSTPPGFQRPMG